jgi:Zn-dependent peptidase ImmA (M78 family)
MNQLSMSNVEIEELCEAMDLDYIRKFNAPTDYIDIRGLMTNYLGLEIEFESIVEDDETITAFIANGTRELKIMKDGKVTTVLYPQNTIVIDKCYLAPEQRERCRFNMAHEVGHYLMNKLCNTNVASFNRDMITFIPTDQLHEAFNISEARANKIAAAILLPHFVVSNALVRFNNGEPIKLYGENVFSPESRIVVKQMADLLGVSIQTLFIRLRQFGMIEYRPIEELLAKQILGTGDKA